MGGTVVLRNSVVVCGGGRGVWAARVEGKKGRKGRNSRTRRVAGCRLGRVAGPGWAGCVGECLGCVARLGEMDRRK